MTETTGQNSPPLIVTTGNEIGKKGRFIAGLLLIATTLSTLLMLIGSWPDKLPKSDETSLYHFDLFSVRLIDPASPCDTCFQQKALSATDSVLLNASIALLRDTANAADSLTIIRKATTLRIVDSIYKSQARPAMSADCCEDCMSLNTLLLLLVFLAGFLGGLIHISSSFTNYVGSEKFKKSWLLWYVVKPFTGSALALVLFFIFRAGLLGFNDATNINLYGIITLAALTGLFTDKATMKLEEIFGVIFRAKDDRPDKLKAGEVNVKITGIKPESLLGNADNELVISGEGLDRRKLLIKIDEEEIKNPVIKADSISFTYNLPESDKKEFMLRISDEEGKEIYTSKLMKGEAALASAPTTPDNAITESEQANEASNQEEFGDPDTDTPDDINKPQE